MKRLLPKLDCRLSVIASMVREGSRCADVGTDHGYLIAWLAASGKIPGGFACDINKKPLEKAALTLSAYASADKVKLLLCDGLAGLQAGTVDDIVIAGMGGDLIWEIMSTPAWTRNPNLRFILQPMTKPERLRRKLYENGFHVLRETAVVSGDFPYAVMQVAYTGEPLKIEPAFAYCGLLLNDDSEPAKRYVSKTARLIREKVDGLSKSPNAGQVLEDYRQLLEILESRCAQ